MESLTRWQLLLVLFTAICVSTVSCFSTGAPADACSTLTPNRGRHQAPSQTTTVPYEIDMSVFLDANTGQLLYIPATDYQSKQNYSYNSVHATQCHV